MQKQIIGWDIGGAHLKAALLDQDGRIARVLQRPCPLWLGVDRLHQAVGEVLQDLPVAGVLHAVTMTGELVDCFASREDGVVGIIQAMRSLLPNAPISIYAGRAGFLATDDVGREQVMNIASANWLASATLAAEMKSDALFVDIGSTTTDILLIESNRVSSKGYSDYERLVSGELLYTGIVRTAVMAIAQQAEFNGKLMGLMMEYFATMADVYRLTGDLNEAHDQSATADGAEKSSLASARRLSRMTGYEFDAKDLALWQCFAEHLRTKQLKLITAACSRQLERRSSHKKTCLIGAGIGRFLVRDIATVLQLDYLDFSELLPPEAESGTLAASDCAPAVAVAYLASRVG
jgi:probable H4MPT-linked C1 transfer pathway protein